MAKVVKFGGTSLADGKMIRHAASIIQDDSERRYVVVSAPGKRFPEDVKVTDLLHELYDTKAESILEKIRDRFACIIEELGISFDLSREMDEIREHIQKGCSLDWALSRGEYLNAKIISAYLEWPFIDAVRLIQFKDDRMLSENKTFSKASRILREYDHAVIPGFYGSDRDHQVVTFSRGGSDVTGAVIARCVNAEVYENWTDVNGIMSADPRIIDYPKQVKCISYRELRELSYMGASVLHEDAIFPLRNTGIPIRVCNTMNPSSEGTLIVARYPVDLLKHPVTGIAGKKGFSNLQIEMAMMNSQIGFGAKVLEIIAKYGISYEHTPTSIDIISVIAETEYLEAHRNQIIMEIDQTLHPDRIFIEDSMALVAVVGEGISTNVGVAAKVLQSIADAGINVRMIDAGCSELNIIIGVNESDYEKTIHALYDGLHEYL